MGWCWAETRAEHRNGIEPQSDRISLRWREFDRRFPSTREFAVSMTSATRYKLGPSTPSTFKLAVGH